MNFEMQVALRHLKSGGGQTVMTVSAVATAVLIIIFITSLIRGVQERFFGDLIGSIPHITLKPLEPVAQSLAEASGARDGVLSGDRLLTSRRESQAQQRKEIENWSTVAAQLAQFPDVKTVVPAVRGQAFLMRGSKRFGLTISGADPREQERISHLQDDIVAGNWLTIGPEDIVIGYKLAEEAGINIGDRVRVQSSEGVTSVFTVAGLFSTGLDESDKGAAYVTLRAAQGLFAMRRSVSVLLVQVAEAFDSNRVADSIAAVLPYKTESWMREQAEIMDALRVQNSTTTLISVFSLLASMLGISSVLIVSVIQKSKQIGILKSMGARERQILLIFTYEGLGIGVLGVLAGGGLSYALLISLMQLKRQVRVGKIDELFPVILDPGIFAAAMLAGLVATVVAALLPARRAARLNPVEVIHGG
jgi:lipoprotein-releasing system permease protein